MVILFPWNHDLRKLLENEESVSPENSVSPTIFVHGFKENTTRILTMSDIDKKSTKPITRKHSRGASSDSEKQGFRLAKLSSQLAKDAQLATVEISGNTPSESITSETSRQRKSRQPTTQSSSLQDADVGTFDAGLLIDIRKEKNTLSKRCKSETNLSPRCADANNNEIKTCTNNAFKDVSATSANTESIKNIKTNKSNNNCKTINNITGSSTIGVTDNKSNGSNRNKSTSNCNSKNDIKDNKYESIKGTTVVFPGTGIHKRSRDRDDLHRIFQNEMTVTDTVSHVHDRPAFYGDDALNKSLLLVSDMPSHQTFMYPAEGRNDSGRFGTWHPHPPKAQASSVSEFFAQGKLQDNEKPSSINKAQTISTSFIAQNIAVYDRLQRLDRTRMFEFHHYPDEPTRYMKEYRSVHTVGHIGREARRQAVLGKDVADPYSYLPSKRLYQGNSVVKTWQQRLVEEQQQREQLKDTPICCPDNQHQTQQHQQQQQQQEQQHLHDHNSHHSHPTQQSPSLLRYFPTLAPTREATAFIKGASLNKGRLLPSQLTRSKSLALTRSFSEDLKFLPTIPSPEGRLSLVRQSNDTQSKRSSSQNSYSVVGPRSDQVCLDANRMNTNQSTNHLQSSENKDPCGLLETDMGDTMTEHEANSIATATSDTLVSVNNSFSSNVTGEHNEPTESGSLISVSGKSVTQSTDTTVLSQYTFTERDGEEHASKDSSQKEIELRKVWRNPDEFERKYCPDRDKTMLSNRSDKRNQNEIDHGEVGLETNSHDEGVDSDLKKERRKRLRRDNDYSQLIIEVTNLRLVSPLSSTGEDDTADGPVDTSRSSHLQKTNRSSVLKTCTHKKPQGNHHRLSGPFKDKVVFAGHSVKKARIIHQCSRFNSNGQRLDFDGACRYHTKDNTRSCVNENGHFSRMHKTSDHLIRGTEASQQKMVSGDCKVFQREEYNLELKGTEYKYDLSLRLNRVDSNPVAPMSLSNRKHVSVKSSIEEVSHCNGAVDQEVLAQSNESQSTKLLRDGSLSTCLQTVPKGPLAKRQLCATHMLQTSISSSTNEDEISHKKAVDSSSAMNAKSKANYQMEDWKNIMDAGECGFIVRAIPVAKGGGLSAREKTDLKDAGPRKQESLNEDSASPQLVSFAGPVNIRQIPEKPLELEIIGCVTNPVSFNASKNDKATASYISKTHLKSSEATPQTLSGREAESQQSKQTEALEPSTSLTKPRLDDSQRTMIPQVNLDLDGLPSPDGTKGQKEQSMSKHQPKKKTEPPLLQVRRPPLFDPFSVQPDMQGLHSWRPDLSSTSSTSDSEVKSRTILNQALSESDPPPSLASRTNTLISHRAPKADCHERTAASINANLSNFSTDHFSSENIKMKPELQLYAHIRKGLCCGKKAEELFQKPTNVNGQQILSARHQ